MLLLAIDTSGPGGSIALAHGGAETACERIELAPIEGGTFSAQLIPQVANLLAKHNVSKLEIEGFAVTSGPGSFTGLRVGLAAVKALAEVLHKPIAAVSLLEAVAASVPSTGSVTAVLDAGRNEVFVGNYEVKDGKTALIREQLLMRTDWLQAPGQTTVITPDQIIADAAVEARFSVCKIDRPRADDIATLGWTKILKGEIVTIEDLDANYIRRSDAETFSKRDV